MHCQECNRISPEDLTCTKCSVNYYINSQKECVTENKCGENYYPENKTMTCTLCHKSCFGCEGPDNFGCIKCNVGYILSSDQGCIELKCNENEYINTTVAECHSKYLYFVVNNLST